MIRRTADCLLLLALVFTLLAHGLLIVSFLKKQPLRLTQWIQWAILSLLASGLIQFFPGKTAAMTA